MARHRTSHVLQRQRSRRSAESAIAEDLAAAVKNARLHCRRFFPWYNDDHHHSGICLLTPYQVHHRLAGEVLARRHRILLDAYHQHPERFVLGPDQDWQRFVVAQTKNLAMTAVALPGEVRRFLSRAQRGELELRFAEVDNLLPFQFGVDRVALGVSIIPEPSSFTALGLGLLGALGYGWLRRRMMLAVVPKPLDRP